MGIYFVDIDKTTMEYKNGVNFEKLNKKDLLYLEEMAEQTKSKIICSLPCVDTNPKYAYLKEDFIKDNPQIALVLVIKSKIGKLDGLLILGCKRSNSRYSLDDVYFLASLIVHVESELERIKLQHKLIKKSVEAKQLEDLNKAKSFFVSSVSHDLQTPLTSIKMFSELLREKKDLNPEKRGEFISVIENESERLSRLIKNVLDLSQIERGVKSYDFRDVDLSQTVNKVVKLMHYSLEQNGFTLHLDLVRQPLHIKGDEDAIVSCIVNLISNAMKYSPADKEIRIETFLSDDGAILKISDKGMGIPQEEQNKIFDTFYRSESEQTQNVAGVGLGLTITNHVIKAHNATISLKSEPGSGTTFTLSFPLQ